MPSFTCVNSGCTLAALSLIDCQSSVWTTKEGREGDRDQPVASSGTLVPPLHLSLYHAPAEQQREREIVNIFVSRVILDAQRAT